MRRLLLAVLVLSGLACGGSDSPTDPAQVTFAGTFTLRTVNGQPLPYVAAQSGQTSVTLLSDAITIADGGTWSESGTYRTVQNGQSVTQTYSGAGSWLRTGSSLGLYSVASNSLSYSGTFTSSVLTLNGGSGTIYVFAK